MSLHPSSPWETTNGPLVILREVRCLCTPPHLGRPLLDLPVTLGKVGGSTVSTSMIPSLDQSKQHSLPGHLFVLWSHYSFGSTNLLGKILINKSLHITEL